MGEVEKDSLLITARVFFKFKLFLNQHFSIKGIYIFYVFVDVKFK